MNQVDWNKAPEGATHWEFESADGCISSSWMRCENGIWYFWPVNHGVHIRSGWVSTYTPNASRISRMIARPTNEWNGKGTAKFKHYPTQIEIVDEENELVATITTFDAASAEVTFVSGFLTNAVDWPSVSEQILEGLKKLELEIS